MEGGMMKWHWIWSCVLVSLLTISHVHSNQANEAITPEFEDLIDAFVEETLTCRDIVGMNLAVIRGNETLLAKGYGIADIDQQIPVDNATIFGIASLSKAFAATLLGVLLDKDDSLSWDTPVKDILGDDFYFYDILRSEKITLRDMLTHQTGVPPNNWVRLAIPRRADLALKMRFFEPTKQFRGEYMYSNIMYGLLSYVSEIIGGKSWEDLMREHIFLPLGMTNTTFTHETNLSRSDMAVPYLPDGADAEWRAVSYNLHSEWGQLGGSGSVITNALDMAKWMKMHINLGANSDGNRVVSEQTIKDTHEPHIPIPEDSSTTVYRRPNAPVSYVFHTYGLGWRQGYYRGYRIVTHTGTSWGYGALLTLVPDLDIAIHTTITGPDGRYRGRRNIHMYVMDLLMGEQPWLNITDACTFPEETQRRSRSVRITEGLKADLPLDAYVGTYGHFGYGNITISLPGDGTLLHMSYGNLGKWNLYPTEEPHGFVGDGLDDIWNMDLSDLWFETKEEGDEVERLVVESFERNLPPVFVRDLKMSEAPEPPELCPVLSSGNMIKCSFTLLFAVSLAVGIWNK